MKRRQQGFGMLDVLTGLLLTAVVGFVAVPGFNEMLEAYQLRSTANMIGFEIARARTQAANEGRPVCLRVDGQQIELRMGTTSPDCGDGDPFALAQIPQRITVDSAEVRFDGNGLATMRPPIAVHSATHSLTITTDVLGRVTIS